MNGAGLKIGERIREARQRRRLTLQRVSSMTGLSIGFLSQVERDITTPSLSSLATISTALDQSVSAFLHQPDLPNAVSRHDGRVAYPLKGSRAAYEQLSTTFPGQMLNALKVHVPGGYQSETSSYEGEELVYVLSGTVRYVIDGTIYELQSGDALHYSAHRPHHVVNPCTQPAEVISIGTQLFQSEMIEEMQASAPGGVLPRRRFPLGHGVAAASGQGG
jgi:transcriptional regulator with XRE-family HTH domain